MRCKSFLDGDDEDDDDDTAVECSIIESSATRYIGQRQATIGDVECCKYSVCGTADLDDTASGRNWIRTVVAAVIGDGIVTCGASEGGTSTTPAAVAAVVNTTCWINATARCNSAMTRTQCSLPLLPI